MERADQRIGAGRPRRTTIVEVPSVARPCENEKNPDWLVAAKQHPGLAVDLQTEEGPLRVVVRASRLPTHLGGGADRGGPLPYVRIVGRVPVVLGAGIRPGPAARSGRMRLGL